MNVDCYSTTRLGLEQRDEYVRLARWSHSLAYEETRRLLSPPDSLRLADWLAANGHAQAALSVYRRHLRDYPSGPGVAEAHLGAGLVQWDAFGQAAAAYQHFLDALQTDPTPEIERAARDALQSIADRQKYAFSRFRRA